MRNVLFVSSSLMGENSKSRQVGAEIVSRVAGPRAHVVERHLTPDNIPHLTLETLGAFGVAAEQRTPAQTAAVKFADSIIEEVEAADVIVIGAPMYNFSVPSTLKAWLDHVARAGRTFKYTANGPEGLLKGKKIYVVASRGGYYTGESPARVMDFQEPYIRAFWSFLGVTDVNFIHVEGQAIGAEAAAKGVADALAAAGKLETALAA